MSEQQPLWREKRDHHAAIAEQMSGSSAPAHASLALLYQLRIQHEGECRCATGMKFHANNCPEYPAVEMLRAREEFTPS